MICARCVAHTKGAGLLTGRAHWQVLRPGGLMGGGGEAPRMGAEGG